MLENIGDPRSELIKDRREGHQALIVDNIEAKAPPGERKEVYRKKGGKGGLNKGGLQLVNSPVEDVLV